VQRCFRIIAFSVWLKAMGCAPHPQPFQFLTTFGTYDNQLKPPKAATRKLSISKAVAVQ